MKPSTPKGTRDFSPQEMVKRNHIFDTIRKVYQSYGYQPIETPAMENLETLMGKYGEEGDRLIFKILNSGNFLEGIGDLESVKANKISEKALRYDLTVPFARYVVQHRNDITFPFKRYQIQPVWRADRPQKGRYREFYQCDADVIGSDSLLNEVELIQIIDDVFTRLDIPIIIRLNNRKILQGIAEYIEAPDRMLDIAIAIDKLDKIGEAKVMDELREKGFNSDQITTLFGLMSGGKDLNSLRNLNYLDNENIKIGSQELEFIFRLAPPQNSYTHFEFDLSLARGLNYYTGTIIEVKVFAEEGIYEGLSGSLCGGGRYDDLTGIFGLPDISGVGISFGADRIYDVMHQLDSFRSSVKLQSSKVLFINFGEKEALYCLGELRKLHQAGISAELYPDVKKIAKQFEYADKKNIPYVAIIGGNEIMSGIVKLKNMVSGEEKQIPSAELVNQFRNNS